MPQMGFISLKASDSCWAKCWCYPGSAGRLHKPSLNSAVGSVYNIAILFWPWDHCNIFTFKNPQNRLQCKSCVGAFIADYYPPEMSLSFTRLVSRVILEAVAPIMWAAFDFQAASFLADSAKWSKLDYFGLIRAWKVDKLEVWLSPHL